MNEATEVLRGGHEESLKNTGVGAAERLGG